MEDIGAKINEILSSPEQMQNLQNLASMLGLGNGSNTPPSSVPAGQLSASPPSSDGNSLLGSLDPAMVSSIVGLIHRAGKLEKEDSGVAFLRALKPLLGAERGRRVDDAARLLILARMLPLLKDAGILSFGN